MLGLLLDDARGGQAIGPAGGSIINISSIVGPMPVKTASRVYSADQGGGDAMTVALSQELGPGKSASTR